MSKATSISAYDAKNATLPSAFGGWDWSAATAYGQPNWKVKLVAWVYATDLEFTQAPAWRVTMLATLTLLIGIGFANTAIPTAPPPRLKYLPPNSHPTDYLGEVLAVTKDSITIRGKPHALPKKERDQGLEG